MNKEKIKNALGYIFSEKLYIPLNEELFSRNYIELGINSILFVKLLINLEVELGIEFEEEIININRMHNLNELIQYICEKYTNNGM